MKIVRIVYRQPEERTITTYLRDPHKVGRFVCGVECNAWGVGVREEGCFQEKELWIREDRVSAMTDLGEGVRP